MPENFFPLVSIAVCTFNGAKYLEEQLISLVNQTYKRIEIIIVDDDSNDETWDTLVRYQTQYSFIKCYKNEKNLGHTRNFEKAIKLCSGSYIALSDQDDVWNTNKIQLLINNIGSHALIYHDSELINEDSSLTGFKISDLYNMYEGTEPMPFFFVNFVSGHSMLFKKELCKHFLPLSSDFYHDWFIAIIATQCGGIKYFPDTLVKYRQHIDSATDILKQKTPTGIPHLSLFNEKVLKWLRFCVHRNPENMKYAAQLLSCFEGNKMIKKIKLLKLMLQKYQLLFYRFKKSNLSKLNLVRKTCLRLD